MSSSVAPARDVPTLRSLQKGQSATIADLRTADTAAVDEHLRRLRELGFLPGEQVRVVARGFPAGDPIAVRIGHATFALRGFEADLILLAPVARS